MLRWKWHLIWSAHQNFRPVQLKNQNLLSDATLQILSNNLVPKFQVTFKDVFPTSLSTVTFDATDTDIEYFTAEVSFKYTMYNIVDMRNRPL